MGLFMISLRLAALLIAATAVSTTAYAQAMIDKGREKREQKAYVPMTKQEKTFPVGTNWVAVSLNGQAFTGGADRPTFMVDQQFRGRGFGGCNNFSATVYPLRQQTLAVGPIAITKRKCPGNLNASEQNFLTALRTSRQWDIVGPNLVVRTERGELRFQRSF